MTPPLRTDIARALDEIAIRKLAAALKGFRNAHHSMGIRIAIQYGTTTTHSGTVHTCPAENCRTTRELFRELGIKDEPRKEAP